MHRCLLALIAIAALAPEAAAQAPPSQMPRFGVGVLTQPVVIYDAQGKVVSLSEPSRTMMMPFIRATPSPFILPLTATPQQFLITQPAGATTYRAFNPCVHAHVRIRSVLATAPVVSEATAYPGVRRVTSPTETIDRLSGYWFGPGPETLGSAANPMGGPDRIVSGMIVAVPGYPADLSNVTCEFELGYGQSG